MVGRSGWLVGIAIAAAFGVWGCSGPSTGDGDGDGDGDSGGDDGGRDAGDGGGPDADGPGPDGGLPPLAVTAVQPSHGPWTGGTSAVVRGRGFEEGATVSFGARLVEPLDVSLVDDNRLAVTTPAGEPGAVDVRVALPDGREAVLDDGFVFDGWYVDPPSGSAAGGSLVRLIGNEAADFQPDSTVTFDGAPATDVVVVGPTEITCRTPPGAVGPADVGVESVTGTQVLREGFVYYDSTDPLNGGLGGGPLEGTLDVTVLDAFTSEPLPGSFVILGTDGATPFQGYTDERGQITFSDPALTGRQTITAAHEPVMLYDDDGEPLGEMTFESTTIVEFDARSVTIFLLPVPPPQPGSPPPGRRGGAIDGELLFESRGEFGPYEWEIIPEPLPPDEVKVAYVYTSQSSIWTDRMSTGEGGTVYDTEEYRGTNGYRFSIYTRPAAVAVYALAGILNTVTGEFRPYVMGVTRGVVVGPDEVVSGVQIYMTRQLGTSLSVVLEEPPVADESGTPNRYVVEAYIDLGAEGVIGRPETTLRSESGLRPFLMPGWTELGGNLADASYTVVAGAWTVRPGSDEESNPWSVVIRQGITDLESDVVVDGFLGVPRALSPEPGGVMVDDRMAWEAIGQTPDFTMATLSLPGGLLPIPYWFVILRGGVTAYELPDLPALAGLDEHPSGDVVWQVWSHSVPGFDFDSWSYRYLANRYWSAYAVDGWYVRLRAD